MRNLQIENLYKALIILKSKCGSFDMWNNISV